MTAIVQRDDLSTRTALSKSALTSFDYCQTAGWFDLHYRLPLIPSERLTFGSAVDAAVEAAIKYLRAEQPIDEEVCTAAAAEVIARDGVEVDLSEVSKALILFVAQVAGHYDFRLAKTQERLSGELPDLGEVDGHPDVILADNRIYDVKTTASNRGKPDLCSIELAFYALLHQEITGTPIREVGYWTFVRGAKRPYWEIKSYEITDQLLQWAVEKSAAYVRAKRADARLNEKATTPINWSMTGGPAWPGKCADCQYQPMCPIAYRGASNDNAA